MARTYSRAHVGQLQVRTPRSMPADQVSGGGSEGDGAEHMTQTVPA